MTTKRHYIHWTRAEQAQVAAEWLRLKAENPAGLKLDRAAKAQQVLPPTRQRPITSTSAASQITRMIARYLESVPPTSHEAEPERIEVPVLIEQPALTLDELPVGLLLGVVVDRLLAAWEGRPVAAAVKILATVPTRYVTPREPPRVAVPRIGIVGLKHDQFQQVKQRVNGKSAELVFLNKDSNPGALPPSVRYCIVQKHTSHKWYDQAQASVGSERTFFIEGGISSVVQKVNEILAKL